MYSWNGKYLDVYSALIKRYYVKLSFPKINTCLFCSTGKKRGSPRWSVPSGEPLAYSGRRSVIKIKAFFEVVNSFPFVIFPLQGCAGE
jgi:hypothetical protein